MKNAQDLLESVQANYSAMQKGLREQVQQRVEAFIEKWSTESGRFRSFTRAEMEENFINPYVAKLILEEAGFGVAVTLEKETGYLWWKKKIPEKWEISIPMKQT